MKKLLGMLLLAGALLSMPLAGSAQAEKVDLGKFTCGELIELAEEEDVETLTMIYFWLDGYFSAKSGDTVLDADAVEESLTEILKRCATQKSATVLSVISQ